MVQGGPRASRGLPGRDGAAHAATPLAVGAPQPAYLCSVSFRFDAPAPFGETPDGLRVDLQIRGTLGGPHLRGEFLPFEASLFIQRDGLGVLDARARLRLDDGATAELATSGRYGDFGRDGYRTARGGHLPESPLAWCPRLLSADPRYAWLNRTTFLAVGWLWPAETRAEFDVFSLSGSAPPSERGGRELG